MKDLSLEIIEFIKILANSDSTILEKGMNSFIKNKLNLEIATILRDYYYENTLSKPPYWITKFEDAGISEDEGKAAIACARRLGLDIS